MMVRRPKGTLRLLEEWISATVRLPDPTPVVEAIDAFKEVRRLRQRTSART